MPDVPANQRLWNMLVAQARAKFPKFPSLPASRWIHEQYVQKGGQFLSAREAAKRKPRERDEKESKNKKDEKGEK